MRRLFGTDGIRGIAGRTPLTASDVLALGRCAGEVLREHNRGKKCRVLAVRDTRGSGRPILDQLARGLREQGIDVYDAGVLATPSVACLIRSHSFDSGVVISASHNPPEFNGIKFFNGNARKWADEWERLVEKKFFAGRGKKAKKISGALVRAENLAEDYEKFLIETLGASIDFTGIRIGLDCSHGANSHVAPDIFRRLGADVHAIGVKPNGRNINVGCGSQHTGKLSKLVLKKKCHLGIAFDGDGDRVIMVDEKGRAVDGDHIIALLARALKRERRLKGGMAVITVMANLGLKKALKKIGVRTVEVSVGDRYVSEAMSKHKAVLGGEQSGHIILGEFLPTGDGLLTALQLVRVIRDERRKLSDVHSWMKKYPQVLKNLPVKERIPLEELDGVGARIRRIEKTLGDNGRVLVRYSGTEPLLRIMLEGPSKPALEKFATEIADSVLRASR